MIVGIGDIHRAGAVDGHASRGVELRGARPSVFPKFPARPAKVVTTPAGVIIRIV